MQFLKLLPVFLLLLFFDQNTLAAEFEYENCMENNPPEDEDFDFIVVGAGATGAVVANRLSESGNYSVLLLEAGGPPHWSTEIPRRAEETCDQSQWDWNFLSTPQSKAGFGFPNNRIKLYRGKMLGGSSSHNGMYYIRGNSRDYDKWAELVQDDRWNFTNVLPYLKKIETYYGSYYTNSDYRGGTGPLQITEQNFRPLNDEWLAAGAEFGFPINQDQNADQVASFFPSQVNIDQQGRRSSAYEGYLAPARDRTNLKILCNAYVTKVNFADGEDKRVEGVTFIRHWSEVTIKARKEVILSAGAYQTPQLLMLSGIGDATHLREVGITPRIDIPAVGRGLQDHPGVLFGPFILNTRAAIFSTKGDPTWPNALYQLLPSFRPNWPDYDLDEPAALIPYSVTLVINHGLPKSEGVIRLASSNPVNPPEIDVNYFDVDEDLTDMVDMFKLAVTLLEESASFARFGTRLWGGKMGQCAMFEDRSDEYFRCYLRHYARTGHHPSCTARMGKAGDVQNSVVDTNLKVHGVLGLRIADASVFPTITNANIHAPCFMIGEMVADFVLKEWQEGTTPPTDQTTPTIATTLAAHGKSNSLAGFPIVGAALVYFPFLLQVF
ncbi:Oxygen-dependent choline dehydrogenase [Folsomia candida]|uniref:Oxygen-dependent choline dehydrogenase n=1 Tax=Folsomia candida TaxID=158441 RepID=A0A226E7K4_FOLCA|nr:Oxygen-dependent choline dehydrogenase [Folsomia candida]